MSRYLARLKALKSEIPLHEVLPKPTKPPFGSFGSKPNGRFGPKLAECIWQNPYPQGTPEARMESFRVTEAAQRREPIRKSFLRTISTSPKRHESERWMPGTR
jgi:hypothetical protein